MAEQRRAVSIYINGREINNTLKSIAAEKRKVSNELERMTRGTEEYENKIRELQQLNGIIREHYDSIRNVDNAWTKVKAGASALAGAAASYFTADAVIAYGKKLFDISTQMELLSKKARTVFGESLPSITREAQANATAMGLTTSEYINAAAAIGDLLVPMGFQRQEAADISSQLVNLSGALSEWSGGQISAQQVSEKLSNALLGEREELKALGIAISQADVDARVAAEGLDKLTGKALEQAEAQATLTLIMEKSVDAQTAYAGNSDTMARRQTELLARFQELQEKLAVALIPVFERLMAAAELVGGIFSNLGENVDENTAANERALKSVINLKDQFNLEIETLKRGNISQENRKILIEQINSKYGQYLPNLISEKASIEEITVAQEQGNKAFMERITIMAFEGQIEELRTKQLKAKQEELELQLRLTEAEKNRAAAIGQVGMVYGETGERNIRQAANQVSVVDELNKKISQNAKEQAGLNTQLEKYQNLAGQMGVNLGGATSTPSSADEQDRKAREEEQRIAQEKAAQEAQKRRQAQAKMETDEIEKQQKQVQQILEKYRIENQLSKLSEDEKKVEQLRISFDKEIAVVKELEAKKVQGATEQRIQMERYKEQAINALLDEQIEAQIKKEEEDSIKIQEAKDQIALKSIEQELAMRENLNQMINDFTLSEQEKALLELDGHYQEMIAMAEKLGVDTTDITTKYLEERNALNKKFDAENIKNVEDAITKELDLKEQKLQQAQSAFNAIGNAFTDVMFAFAGESKVAAEFQKGITLAQIAFDTAKAISGVVATAASGLKDANPFTFAIRIATGVATVLANIAKAKQLLTQPIPDAPTRQRYTGGYYDVIGERDGRNYNARFIGRPGTGMLPGSPSLVLASEKGAEYFVANEDLRNPKVMNYVRAIENIRMNRVNQFQDGGATADNAIPPLPAGFDPSSLALLQEISNKLDTMYARIDDQTVVEIWRRYKKINEASGYTL